MPEIIPDPVEVFLLAKFEPAASAEDTDIIISTKELVKKLMPIFPTLSLSDGGLKGTDVYQLLYDNNFLMTPTTKALNPKWLLKLKA